MMAPPDELRAGNRRAQSAAKGTRPSPLLPLASKQALAFVSTPSPAGPESSQLNIERGIANQSEPPGANVSFVHDGAASSPMLLRDAITLDIAHWRSCRSSGSCGLQAGERRECRASDKMQRISNIMVAPTSAVFPVGSNGGDTSTTSAPIRGKPRRPLIICWACAVE